MPRTSKVSSSSKTKNLSKPDTITTQYKSAELVEDSDDEGENEGVRTPHKPVKNPTVFESKPAPSEIESKGLPISGNLIPNGEVSTKKERNGRSSAAILPSDRRSEGGRIETDNAKAGKVVVDENSEDEGSREKSSEERSEGSSTGSETETDSASGDDEGTSDGDTTQSKDTASTISQKQATSRNPVPQYQLPSGFEPATITIPSSSMLTDILSPNSLRTKQIWHITVPSSVPISSLREVSTQSVQSGSAVLTHEGAAYGLVPKVQDQGAKALLLVPSAQTNEYKSAEAGISKTFNLQQLIPEGRLEPRVLPADRTNSVRKYEKPVRQQPEGLKMRYRPFGDMESEQSGFESSSKRSNRTPKFRKPTSIETSLSIKNIDHELSDAEMGGNAKSAIKKRERKRHSKSLTPAESFQTESPRVYTSSPKVSKKRKSPPESDNERPSKKNKRKVPPESAPDARNSPLTLNAVRSEASAASKGSKMQKKHSHAERNGIETPTKSQKHKPPSESGVVTEMRLADDTLGKTRKPIEKKLSVEPVTTNGYIHDRIMQDQPLSNPTERKTEETSHHQTHPRIQPDRISVRQEIQHDDEVRTEARKAKEKPTRENQHQERKEKWQRKEKENIPTSQTTNSVTEPASEAPTDPTIKPEERKRRPKKKKKRERSERAHPTIIPANPPHPHNADPTPAAPSKPEAHAPDPAAAAPKPRKKNKKQKKKEKNPAWYNNKK